jgi:predicted ferric reductase
MARSLGPDHQIDLYYSVINKEDAVFLNELNELAKVNKNFNIIPWYTNDQGYITAKEIMEKSRGLGGKDILLCGPPIFMESLRQQLNQRGVADRFIHWEKFSFV